MKKLNHFVVIFVTGVLLSTPLLSWKNLPGYSVSASPLFSSTMRSASGQAAAGNPDKGRINNAYGKLPMSFELNQGQADSQVRYLSRGRGYQVLLTDTEAVLRLHGADRKSKAEAINSPLADQRNPQSSVLRLKLDGASAAGQITGLDPLPGKSNYLIGSDPKKSHRDIPNYARVEYHNVYPGVSLAYYGTQRALEYDFIVAPGADPGVISVSFEGVERVEPSANGDLALHLNGEIIYQRSPVIYQQAGGRRRAVAGRYVMKGAKQVGFEVEGYDASKPLVIDPTLEYSTYLGGGGDDAGQSVKVDSTGAAYIAGVTFATDFTTKSAAQAVSKGGTDAFVTKLSASGATVVYSTYLGGSGDDAASGIAVNSTGEAYVTGNTTSTDFNTRNPLQTAARGGTEAFVAKLSANGSQLVYSTYLGSSGEDAGFGVAVDSSGAAYVTGYTSANDFNTQAPIQTANRGEFDAFVAKINPTGAALVYSTYLGGTGSELGTAIAVDAAGTAYVTGYTNSTDFNLTSSPLQAANGGNLDLFVAKIRLTSAQTTPTLVYSTYLGGADDDQGAGVAADSSGNAYLTGSTYSLNFPVTTNALQPTRKGDSDAFATKINSAGSALTYSTYIGGSGPDSARGLAIDATGNCYIAGETYSTDFPIKNAPQAENRGASDAFVVKINPTGGASLFATYLGGGGLDTGYAISVDSSGGMYVAGATDSRDFNVNNAMQGDNLGGTDAFVTKISADGSDLTYSTYLGGSGNDSGLSVAVDSSGAAYLTGATATANFEVANPIQGSSRGSTDAFVVKISADGTALVYATYLGGSGFDQGLDIAVDQSGSAYVTGVTASADFNTRQPLQTGNGGGGDAFIAKLNAAGDNLVYSTYFGGGGSDSGQSIAVDSSGAAYVTGITGSTNLQVKTPLQANNRGQEDAFIAKINPAGSTVVYATYLGGTGSDAGNGIAVDASGAAYVTGVTSSTDFNIKSAFQDANRGELDAFVAKISGDGSTLTYSSYLGGSSSEFGNGIAVDSSGAAYVTGATSSTNFNIRNPLQNANGGNSDAFVTKINPSGSATVYSTYLGGADSDVATSVAVDAAGVVYLTGSTTSSNFPLKNPDQGRNNGGSDAFIATINAAGSDLGYSTYLGGGDADDGFGIAVDGVGNIYAVGQTRSLDLPLANSLQPFASGGFDTFIVKISVAGAATTVSAASYNPAEQAAESIVTAFGVGLATDSKAAETLPLPISLAGTTIKVKDSAQVDRDASLFFVSPGQVNYLLPASLATGPAVVTITSGDGRVSMGTIMVSTVSPGLFSADSSGRGLAAALALRVKADGTQIYEPVVTYDTSQSRFVSIPIDLGPEGEQVILLLFGTGLRGNGGTQNVTVTVGGAVAQPLFLGAQGGFAGLDQCNVLIPRSLAGSNQVANVVLGVGGKMANTVSVGIK